MVLSSPKARSPKARSPPKSRVPKCYASSTVQDDVRSRRKVAFLFVTGSLIAVALTLNSVHLSMLVSSNDDVNKRALVIHSFTSGRELSDGFIHGHVALTKDKKSLRTSMDTTRATKNGIIVQDEDTKSVTVPSVSKRESCFPHNSEAWLQGPRLGNLDEPLMNDDFVKRMTLELPYMLSLPGKAKPFLGQTIAFENSRFMDDAESGDDPKSMRLWAVRLIYLSMLYHQHVLAIPEAEALYGSNTEVCQKERQALGIGRFDFECPNAKYIIASLSNNGLGANIRSGATSLLIAGLITDRIVLFVNNAPNQNGDKYLQKPWDLASCDRYDAQCFFFPSSPCTITHKDIEDAYVLKKPEGRVLLRKGELPDDHKDDKVWVMPLSFVPVLKTPKILSETLHEYSMALIDNVPQNDPRLPVMGLAVDHLLDKDLDRPGGYNFAAANIKLNHALNFYAMRPNLEYSAKMDKILDEIIPDDFDAENSFGLPIRGELQQSARACFKFTRQSTHECLLFAFLSLQHRTNVTGRASVSRFTNTWKAPLSYGKSIRIQLESIRLILPLSLPLKQQVWSENKKSLKRMRLCSRIFLFAFSS
jgi:hypothetical protein